MNIERIMSQHVRTVRLDDDLDTAARSMWEGDCGSLPVVDEHGEVIAMLTDRDICMHAWSRGCTLRELSVQGAMSANVIVCRPDDPVSQAERLMRSHQIRRLPVIDARKRPVGVISLTDLSREALTEQGSLQPDVPDADVVRTLAAVCEPRSGTNGSARPVARA